MNKRTKNYIKSVYIEKKATSQQFLFILLINKLICSIFADFFNKNNNKDDDDDELKIERSRLVFVFGVVVFFFLSLLLNKAN